MDPGRYKHRRIHNSLEKFKIGIAGQITGAVYKKLYLYRTDVCGRLRKKIPIAVLFLIIYI